MIKSKIWTLAVLCYMGLHLEMAKAQDLLNGAGLFNDEGYGMEDWILVSESSYSSIAMSSNDAGDIYLEMIKNEEASGFYDDGLAFLFKDEDGNPKDVKPYHIHVEIQTGSPDVESCDLRLYSVEVSDETEEEKTTQTICKGSDDFATGGGPNIEGQGANPEKDPASPPRANDSRLLQAVKENEEGDETGENSEESDQENDESGESENEEEDCVHGTQTIEKSPEGFDNYAKVKHSDVAFMRMGFFNHLKLNTDSMLEQFFADTWMAVDMLIDWEEQTVSIYVDNEGVKAVPFFTKRATKLTHVNTLAIYGLTPEGISRFRNLRVCDQICTEIADLPDDMTIIEGAVYYSGLQIITVLSVLYFALAI